MSKAYYRRFRLPYARSIRWPGLECPSTWMPQT